MAEVNKYKIGDIIEGIVTGIESYGIFVTFGDSCTGLIHISEISTSFVKNIRDYAKENNKIKAMIIDIDENNHYKLSIKSLDNRNMFKHFSTEDILHGFDSLSNNLNGWINDKIKEIEAEKENEKK